MLALTLVTSRPCFAESPSHAGEDPRAANGEAAPKQHFEEALVHYREGHYRAAVAELEAALTFDPTSKDLLYNLALVHEKLGQLDRAISVLERYTEIERDPKELERARQAIVRMRGARAELAPPVVLARVPMPLPVAPLAAAGAEPKKTNPWLITTAGISAAAAVVGVIFGVRALSLRPSREAIASPDKSIDDIRADQARAEDSAVIADVSFAVSLLSGAGAAVLWLRDSDRCPEPRLARAPLGVSVGGSF
ncbi:MAG TPA: tetratricopeptide repeat protein [Polyangiaceae bacterium]|nr:tetratricopeptide repeat protein [Polyangiaceae bacterium]